MNAERGPIKLRGEEIIFHSSPSHHPHSDIPIFRETTNQLETHIWQLIPTFGLKKTHQILLDERKQISFEEVVSIAIKKFGETIKTKIKTYEDIASNT